MEFLQYQKPQVSTSWHPNMSWAKIEPRSSDSFARDMRVRMPNTIGMDVTDQAPLSPYPRVLLHLFKCWNRFPSCRKNSREVDKSDVDWINCMIAISKTQNSWTIYWGIFGLIIKWKCSQYSFCPIQPHMSRKYPHKYKLGVITTAVIKWSVLTKAKLAQWSPKIRSKVKDSTRSYL